jgi:molybdopterin converting factor small subunit
MQYCCEKCDAKFSQKFNYDRHMNRKSPCTPEEKEQFDLNKRTCNHCCEIYSSPKAVKVHMNICKKKPSEGQLIKTQKTKFEEIISQLEEKLEKQNNELQKQNNKIENQNNELEDLKTKLSNNNGKIDKQSYQIIIYQQNLHK